MKGERGFALILTLIVTALMVAALVELIHQAYVDISLSRSYRDGQQASLLAESGATGGMKLLQLSLLGKNYTALTDAWATPVKLDDETGTIEITVSEESGRLCINDLFQDTGESELNVPASLKRLGKRLQIPEGVWNALADWLDKDDQTRSNGAETPYYRSLKPPYSARNGSLATITELSLVKGFTPEIVAALRPFVTVQSSLPGATLSPVNINTASKEVLSALDEGIDDRMAERILEERRIKPFQNPGELSRIPGAESISQKLVGKVSVKGTLFRITSIARVKETARTVEVVIRLPDGGTPVTLSWQEY
jgi:general secretion pathway protein K